MPAEEDEEMSSNFFLFLFFFFNQNVYYCVPDRIINTFFYALCIIYAIISYDSESVTLRAIKSAQRLHERKRAAVFGFWIICGKKKTFLYASRSAVFHGSNSICK